MKHFYFIATLMLICSMAISQPQRQDPNKVPPSFYHQVESGRAYTNSQTDTLGGGTAIAMAPLQLGGSNLASIVITVADSCAADVYVDTRVRGTSSWTNVVADSLITTSNTGTKKEFLLRTSTVDKLSCVDCDIRIRIAHRATKNGTTSATRSTQAIWKP
jgi:hypothetical protein